MKIGWEAVNWVYQENNMSSGRFFFESVVEAQVPLKAWNFLATKGVLKELNQITPTYTYTPESTFSTTKSTVTLTNGFNTMKPARESLEKKNKNFPLHLELSFCVGSIKILIYDVTKTDCLGTRNCVEGVFPFLLLLQ
jgi:hypothetical protein